MSGYLKHVDQMGREEFIQLFSQQENPEQWFSEKELEKFPFPKHARSLGARYLVKKRIKEYLGPGIKINQLEILNDDLGKPEIYISNSVKEKMKEHRVQDISCSLSHSKQYIAAMTVFVQTKKQYQ